MTRAGESVVFRVAKLDTSLASVRYRALLPACALQDRGFAVAVCSRPDRGPETARVAIGVKPLTDADAIWLKGMQARGVPTVVDLCDNIFVPGYGGDGARLADAFRHTSRDAVVTVPTRALRDIVEANTRIPPERLMVVPDIVETPALLARQETLVERPRGHRQRSFASRLAALTAQAGLRARRLRRRAPVLLWYGNHGADYANFGISDLLLWHGALADAARMGARLWIVSNHRQRYEDIRTRLPIQTQYFEWTPCRVDTLLAFADVCLVPNSQDAFSYSKSPNRALKALAAGVPVVATATPAMRDLAGMVWLDSPSEGLIAYLARSALRERHLAHARRQIPLAFSMPTLADAMDDVIQNALQRA